MISKQPDAAPPSVAEILGDVSQLAGQIGSPAGLGALSAVPVAPIPEGVCDAASLPRLIELHRARILLPLELPAIVAAYRHASRGEHRELLALDERLSREPALQPFADASRRIGKAQLKRLRPLRDQRTVQRYLAAVENGSAHGWHSVVFGVILALYSLPLRQGLIHYAQQTLHGFVDSAARRGQIPAADSARLLEEFSAKLAETAASALAEEGMIKLLGG